MERPAWLQRINAEYNAGAIGNEYVGYVYGYSGCPGHGLYRFCDYHSFDTSGTIADLGYALHVCWSDHYTK